MTAAHATHFTRHRERTAEVWEFRLVYLAAFVVFLAAAAVKRLLPFDRHNDSWGRRSILGEARVAASSCASFAFMG